MKSRDAQLFSYALLGLAISGALFLSGCSSVGKPRTVATGEAGENALIEEAPEPQRTLVDYKIQKGDTLWDLARAHDTTVSEIKEINSLDSDIIMYGKVIKVPTLKVLEPGEQPYATGEAPLVTETTDVVMDATAAEPAPLAPAPAPVVPAPSIPEY